ncbi:C4-dicarboxylate TRAP transporter substrate-binding protein [Thalassovita taeanensis]|uniref:TRAP-type C4-dicarboxylate transport system, substrate-binding protein n=1 Tax=Thalassovita taeanensis TaxID=657014 RepID=A0A1H9BVN4_9RHOB|nr:C4-dicarboxylate TRAP transporter substrate-binding protein [Thalassovita taeanensis]SEP93036.1 TRAP-type C4-dicarboxylate transport system, substrate-binding protein [Thalassovita taeanensis]
MYQKLNGILVAAAVSAAAFVTPAIAQTAMLYADHGPNRGTRAASTQWFLSEVEARTEGRIVVDQQWAGALLGAKAMLEGIGSDVASLGTLMGSLYPGEFTGWRVGDLPIVNPNEIAGAMAMHEMMVNNESLIAEFDRQNLKYLGSYSVGPAQMICNSGPITTLEDFDGLKVRYAGEYGNILSQFGAIPVSLSVSKAYQALDTGLIDCSQAYGYLILAYKLYEVTNQYVIFDEGTLQTNAMVMNKDAFEALDAADQKILIDVGTEMTKNNAMDTRKANKAAITKLQEGVDGHSVNVSYLSDEAKVKLHAASKASVDAWIEEANANGYDGQALLDEFQMRLAKNLEIYKD